MDVLVLIDKLDDLVHNAKAVPLTDQVRIDREEIYEILDQMRATIPEEIKQARWIVKERQEMLAEAKRECDRILGEAREQAAREASQTEIVKLAERQAQEIIDESRRQARETRLEMEDWADSILSTLEVNLDKFLGAVKRGRERLHERSQETVVAGVAAPGASTNDDQPYAWRRERRGALRRSRQSAGAGRRARGGRRRADRLRRRPRVGSAAGRDARPHHGTRCARDPGQRRPRADRRGIRWAQRQLGTGAARRSPQGIPRRSARAGRGRGGQRRARALLPRLAAQRRGDDPPDDAGRVASRDARGGGGRCRHLRPHAHAVRPARRPLARGERGERGTSVRCSGCPLAGARPRRR